MYEVQVKGIHLERMMVNSRHLLRFDLFQQLVHWLSINAHSSRKGRAFLETNPMLLQVEADQELERLIHAHAEDKIEMKQQMHHHLALLRDVRQRGGTATAIREAYVNMYGGFALDLPPWLEEIEQRWQFLKRLHRPERTNRTLLTLLHTAFMGAEQDGGTAAEIVGELLNEAGLTLIQSSHFSTQTAHVQAHKEAIACHQAALKIFTAQRYPFQHARTAMYLGTACQQYDQVGHQDVIEHAIHYYEAALKVYTREDFPEQWALLQTQLGNAYTRRRMGTRKENLEQAIAYHTSALQVVSSTFLPTTWATAQINLGDTYRQRIESAQSTHLKLAMACYRAALQIYTRKDYPKEWADIHFRLAFIFQTSGSEDAEQLDKHLRCAIVCYESALHIYSPESFPIEHAVTLVNLGNAHRKRPAGTPVANLEQASRCYRSSLVIFTQKDFPVEHQQIQLTLSETEEQLQEHTQHREEFLLSSTRV